MSVLLGSLPLLFAASPAEPIPVILDTDIGDDIDDTWALAMILGSPRLDLKLVTTAWGNTPLRTRLTAKILERVGRTDVPIGTGVKTGDNDHAQMKWLGDYTLDGYKGTVHEDGVQALIDCIHGSDEPVTLIVIGPHTNIGAALERDPSIAENARVVTMAGSVHKGWNCDPGRTKEWNVSCDAKAFAATIAAPWDVTMAPLDSCGNLILRGGRYAKVRQSDNPLAKVVVENYDGWSNRHACAADASSVLFDTEAVYLAMDDAWCDLETIKLMVTDEGLTAPNDNGHPVHCALSWNNRDAFEELLVGTLTGTEHP